MSVGIGIEPHPIAVLDPSRAPRLLSPGRERTELLAAYGIEAAAVLEQIVALDPLDGEALILLGQHYARIEQPERAIFYYEGKDNGRFLTAHT